MVKFKLHVLCRQGCRSHRINVGDIKEYWGSEGRKSPSGDQGQSPGRGPGETDRAITHILTTLYCKQTY